MKDKPKHTRYDFMHERHQTHNGGVVCQDYIDVTDDQLSDLAADQLPQMVNEARKGEG